MTLVRILQTGTLRLSVIFSGVCLLSGVLLFAMIYWQIKTFEMQRLSAFVVNQAAAVSQGTPSQIDWMVRTQLRGVNEDEFHNTIYAALFGADGRLIAGNMDVLPAGLPVDGKAHHAVLEEPGRKLRRRPIIAVARRLPDGSMLVMGRGIGVLSTLESIVAETLLLGAIPAIVPALAAGLWLSRQAQRRVKDVNQAIDRIMLGDVHERLPVKGVADDFDQLASSVNRMLAEIERLLSEVQGVSDNIAHDLRTPLARVRMLLEQGRSKAGSEEELRALADRAIAGLDQAQSIITALLRIGEIESGQRRAAFGLVDLNEIAGVAADLYGPMAEEKDIQFILQAEAAPPICGDRELMIEAIANLLDNAIKFTQPGGTVRLVVADVGGKAVIRVIDNGPGIPPHERTTIMARFYRLDKSRHVKGSGLGLSIVQAIVRLHDFDLVVDDAQPGCLFELRCYPPERVPASTGAESDDTQWIPRWLRRSGVKIAGMSGHQALVPVYPGGASALEKLS
ncbi:MAG TPA: HAMP domain-containing sensor histidine kinase [Rhodopila sp.]|nr:HAMP domain-containing sensor histidine kinase [Rhodopila sp.]